MAYMRDGKSACLARRQWRAWREANAALIEAAGLPPVVLRSQNDWDYLLRYGYHCSGGYPHIDFLLEDLSESQTAALRALLDHTLTDEQKRRGNAAWHHVCPPGRH